MEKRVIINASLLSITLDRLCQQLIENHDQFEHSVLLGLQPKGIFLAQRIHKKLTQLLHKDVPLGFIDATFFRDDFRRGSMPLLANQTKIDFIIEDKKVVLVDDVLYTGRTVRAAMDAMIAFGRPAKVDLLTLIDRTYSRDLPIQATYTGMAVDCLPTEKVLVELTEEEGITEDVISIIRKNNK